MKFKKLSSILKSKYKYHVLSSFFIIGFLSFGAIHNNDNDFPEGNLFSEVVSASCESGIYNGDGNYSGCNIETCPDGSFYYYASDRSQPLPGFSLCKPIVSIEALKQLR